MLDISSNENLLLIQYDLITGNLTEIELESDGLSSVCSNNKNMFVISPIEDKSNKFSVSIIEKNRDNKVLKVCKTKVFSLSYIDNVKTDNSFHTPILFSICDEGKLYFFYKLISRFHSDVKLLHYLYNMHVVTTCIDTMTIVSNQSFTECVRYGTGGVMTQKKNIKTI